MKIQSIILICGMICLSLAACESSNPSQLPSAESGLTTPTPQSSPMAPLSNTTVVPPQETEMASPMTPDPTSQTMVDQAKTHLAQQLGVPVDEVILTGANTVVWRDASLGCPKPSIDYIQVETPGYRITLTVDQQTYVYHTDQTNRVIQCNRK